MRIPMCISKGSIREAEPQGVRGKKGLIIGLKLEELRNYNQDPLILSLCCLIYKFDNDTLI